MKSLTEGQQLLRRWFKISDLARRPNINKDELHHLLMAFRIDLREYLLDGPA